jgi:PAS domain S-box-containing protein
MSNFPSETVAPVSLEQRVLILAPFGRDGTLLAGVLTHAGVAAETCTTIDQLCYEIEQGAGAVLIADEALSLANRKKLEEIISTQPAWSDLPVVVMTLSGESDGRQRLVHLKPLGNVTLLERPLRAETIISAFRMALRARAHQYQLRKHLETEREAAAALRESESRYRTLAEALPQLVWTCSAEGECDYLSRQWLDYTGIPEINQLGTKWSSAIHPADRQMVERAWTRAVREEGDYDVEYRIRRHDGVYRWFKTRGTPLRDPEGHIQKWFGTCTDIEEQKRALEERQDLLNRERQARATAELLNKVGPSLLVELDTARLSQKVTDLATQLTGAQFGALYQSELDVYRLQALSGAADSHPFVSLAHSLHEIVTGHQIVRSENFSDRIKSFLAAPVLSHSSHVTGWMLFGSEKAGAFSELHEELATGIAAQAAIALDNARLFAKAQQAQETLQRSNIDLRRANEDLNQFAYSASHDLQEPLRMVAIYSQMLQRKYKDVLDKEASEYITYTVQGARRMELLLKDLLDYTQVVDGVEEQAEPVDAGQVLARAADNLSQAIKESQATLQAENLPVLNVREVHLLLLFQNLLGNALKYRSKAHPVIDVSAQRDGKLWRLSVKDNGIGIDQQYAKQVFGLFKRLHGGGSQYEGTGIGLAICQKIVGRYGGRIWVESEGEGSGSTFYFTLPGAGHTILPEAISSSAVGG